tara:strand:- start:406 stop:660 length:255 start_codon:yes stop_codon:yes gene_type:complete
MKNQYQTLKGEEAPFKPEALSKIFPQKENAMADEKASSFQVLLKGEETITDLRHIQELIYVNQGIKIGLQQVVNHLIHFYLKER